LDSGRLEAGQNIRLTARKLCPILKSLQAAGRIGANRLAE